MAQDSPKTYQRQSLGVNHDVSSKPGGRRHPLSPLTDPNPTYANPLALSPQSHRPASPETTKTQNPQPGNHPMFRQVTEGVKARAANHLIHYEPRSPSLGASKGFGFWSLNKRVRVLEPQGVRDTSFNIQVFKSCRGLRFIRLRI